MKQEKWHSKVFRHKGGGVFICGFPDDNQTWGAVECYQRGKHYSRRPRAKKVEARNYWDWKLKTWLPLPLSALGEDKK